MPTSKTTAKKSLFSVVEAVRDFIRWRLAHPIKRIKKQIERNPYHPFHEESVLPASPFSADRVGVRVHPASTDVSDVDADADGGVDGGDSGSGDGCESLLVLRFASTARVTAYVVVIVVVVVTILVYTVLDTVSEHLVFPFVVIFFFLTRFVGTRNINKALIVDRKRNTYASYDGSTLVYQGGLHNVYVRLVSIDNGCGRLFCRLVIGGYRTDEYLVTCPLKYRMRSKLVSVGRIMAKNLNVNFFDSFDSSREHLVRHRCPYVDDVEQHLMEA